jgi:hypothetical protein
MKKIKAKGSWASYRDENHNDIWRVDVDEMASTIVQQGWGMFPQRIGNKRAMELCILAEAYLNLRNKDRMKTKKKNGDL